MLFTRLTRSHGGRVALVAVPVGIATAIAFGGVAQGAVPVSFSVSGQQFQISADKLDGQQFSQYAGVAKDTAGNDRQVAIANIGSATLANLCQSVTTETPMGKVGVMITAGGGKTPASAKDLQIGMTDLKGDAEFHDIRIGVDASTLKGDQKGSTGDFAQDADALTIDGVQQTAWSTTAGTFTLTGMHLQLTDGSKSCF